MFSRGNRNTEETTRLTKSSPPPSTPFAPSPSFLRLLRFTLYTLTSLSALATAGFGLSVLQYYNSHQPAVSPAWGSLIAVTIFGIGTPGVLFGLFLVTPRLFRHGSFGGILNQTRIELVMLFSLSVFWISGALAVACDLRGQENCLWDGYYHYPKPADFNNVCKLINYSVALGYTTFGLCAIQMVVVWSIAIYILLYLDQEVLTEPTNDMGGRAHRAAVLSRQSYQTALIAERANVSTAGPQQMSERSTGGPMTGGVLARGNGAMASSRSLPGAGIRRVSEDGGRRYVDEEEDGDEEEEESNAERNEGEGYYGFENRNTRV